MLPTSLPKVNRRRHRSAAKFGSGGILENYKAQALPVARHERKKS